MKLLKGFLLCLLIPVLVHAYEEKSMPNLAVPTELEQGNLEAGIIHRFLRYPSGQFPDNFINMANVDLSLRYIIVSKLEVGLGYIGSGNSVISAKETFVNMGYSYFIPQLYVRTQAIIQYYRDESVDYPPKWTDNMLYRFNMQSDPILKRISPVINVAYDSKLKKAGLGTGLNVSITDNVDVVAEYYPNIGKRDSTLISITESRPTVNCYAVGIKYSTYGHHFMLTVGNSTDIGMRHQMRGAVNNNIYFGFSIQRLFKL
jgi:hypothetical protein